MGAVVLRDARSNELDAVGAMMVAAYAEYIPPDPAPQWLAYRDEIRDVRRRLHDSTLIVAEDGGVLLGAVTYYPDASKEANGGLQPTAAALRLGSEAPARG